MPKGFTECVRRGGRVRTKKLSGDRYIKLCFIGGKSYAGEAHKKKGNPGNDGSRRKLKTEAGKKQAATVMKEFHAGKLRSSAGTPVTSEDQAQAIAMSEGRAAEKEGRKRRTWRGRTRMRPRK